MVPVPVEEVGEHQSKQGKAEEQQPKAEGPPAHSSAPPPHDEDRCCLTRSTKSAFPFSGTLSHF